jgi:hypothetical protein
VHFGTGALKTLWLNQNIGNGKERVENGGLRTVRFTSSRQRESDFSFKAAGVNTPEQGQRSGYPVIAV